MAKCFVSACQNRELTEGPGNSGRAEKRFFGFPADPARLKLWLAALRQTDDGQDSLLEDGHVCEDHFLPDDVTADGVSSDAVPVPIRPLSLEDEEQEDEQEDEGVRSSWIAPLSEEEEEEEEEEEADSSNIHDDDDDEDAAVERPHQEFSPRRRSEVKRRRSEVKRRSVDENQMSETNEKRQRTKQVPLKSLMQRFLQLLQTSPGRSLRLRDATERLGCRHQRLNEFSNVLCGLNLVQAESNVVTWTSECPVLGFLRTYDGVQEDTLDALQEDTLDALQEDTLDALIRGCSEQLISVTDDRDNAAMAYVTRGDIGRVLSSRDQTVIVIKAPDGTSLKVREPHERRIQVHLKGAGPIAALTCDLRTEETSGVFVTLEGSPTKN